MILFTLPETDGKMNVNLAFSLVNEDKIDPILKSADVNAISNIFRKHLYLFKMNCGNAAKQWVAQGWKTISQVHFNIYHDSRRMVLLIGDAAHATLPSIGQEMNTTLADTESLIKYWTFTKMF